MKPMAIIGILTALVLGGGLVLAIPRDGKGDDKAGACTAKSDGACSKGEAAVASKGDEGCCAKAAAAPISICEKKAVAIAAGLRAETCPKKSLASLAATLPEIRCEKSREKLLADVKGTGSDEDAGRLILAAVKALPTSAKEGQGSSSKETAAEAGAGAGCCGAKGASPTASNASVGTGCCGAKGAAETAAPSAKGCCGAKAGTETAAAGKGACGSGDGQKLANADSQDKKCGGLCAAKAHLVAAKVRSTACPMRSAEILAEALPDITCKDALAKLTAAVKATDCDVDGGDVILAAAHAKPADEAKK